MSVLDGIFHKRLERIREELNSYIDLHLGTVKEDTYPKQNKKESPVEKVQDKFLNCMKLNDKEADVYEYFDEDSDYASNPDIEVAHSYKQTFEYMPKTLSEVCVEGKALKTSNFLKEKKEHPRLDEILEKKSETFSKMLLRLIDKKGLKDSDVYKRANIDRRLFSKIRGDEEYVPSRKTAISFCFALKLSVDEAKKLLATAGYTLSSSTRFDLIVMYLMENREYNIQFVNIVLNDYGEGTLSR